MTNLLRSPGRVIGMVFATALFAMAQGRVARPGTINYIEGQATLDGQSISPSQLGSIEVQPGQVLNTDHGKAEVLLTPGVFLRIGDFSSVRMISPSLTDTQVELTRGHALVEVAQVASANRLVVVTQGVPVEMEKPGLYQFNAEPARIAVYDGKALVTAGDRTIDVGKGKQLLLTNANLKTQKFDRNQTGELYSWSMLRSEYEAQVNQSAVRTLVVGGPGWYGTGWYWDPWFGTWAFVPGVGYWGSPFGFGFGFYSPVYWSVHGPIYPGPAYHGFYGRSFAGAPVRPAPMSGFRGGFATHMGGRR
jgi:hypothetical protein